MRFQALALPAAALLIAACGGDSNGPTTTAEATRAIQRFTHLADSAAAAGDPQAAEIFNGAAEAVRISGDVSQLGISIDGSTANYNALTVSLHMPSQQYCDEFGCETIPASEENLLLAWQEEGTARVLMLATNGSGTKSVAVDTATLDTSAEPPTGIAIIADENEEGWFSSAGTASSQPVSTSGSCARPTTETPGVSFTCNQATYRWSANFTASEAEGDAIGTNHQVVIQSTVVAGARVSLREMGSNMAMRVGRSPFRSRIAARQERAAK